ncbi:MAG TPA: hypothetical protein VI193_03590 [Acidimicrobiia bacterium]
MAAAALAAVIALGFVFAANQGNEATESVTESRVSQVEKDAWDSRVDFLTQQYHMRQASQPTVNIEKYRLEMAGLIGAITPSTSPEAYKALQQQAGKAQVNPRILVTIPAPVFSPELARLQAVNTARLQAMWSQRYQDLIDRFESQMVPSGHEAFNPSILVTIPAPVFSPELARLQAVNTARLQAMWSQRYQDLIDRFEGQQLRATWPQGFEDLMDTYNARIAAAKVADEAPRVPREKRS